MSEERRKEDNNSDWDKYRIFVIEELKRQGDVQLLIVESVQKINDRLITQESDMKNVSRNVSGVVSLVVSVIVNLIGGMILFLSKKGHG